MLRHDFARFGLLEQLCVSNSFEYFYLELEMRLQHAPILHFSVPRTCSGATNRGLSRIAKFLSPLLFVMRLQCAAGFRVA